MYFVNFNHSPLSLPWWVRVKNLHCRRPRFSPWIGKIPWRREWQPTPVFLPGEPPWTEEPGRLQSMVSHRVRHDWVTNTHTHSIWRLISSSLWIQTGKMSYKRIPKELHILVESAVGYHASQMGYVLWKWGWDPKGCWQRQQIDSYGLNCGPQSHLLKPWCSMWLYLEIEHF